MSSRGVSKAEASRQFEEAIDVAIKDLLGQKRRFGVGDVIDRARYPDGRRVGQTTLYGKNANGDYVHAALIAKLNKACKRSRHGFGSAPSQGSSERASAIAMGAQIVTLLSRQAELECIIASNELRLAHAERGEFIAVSALNKMCQGRALAVARMQRLQEDRLRGQLDLVEASKEAEALAKLCSGAVQAASRG